MKNWLKASLLSFLLISALLISSVLLFNLKIVGTSRDVEFSPSGVTESIESENTDERPKNIIIFIADGMGFSHLSLALMTLQSEDRLSVWSDPDAQGWHDTRSSFGPLTDSGASATAMATGTSTSFGVIGLDQEGNMLENAFELATRRQYNTGIVTDSYIWDATPAAFVAHTESRDNAREILTQIASSELDLLFGELEDLGEGDVPDRAATMDILNKRFQFLPRSLALPTNDSTLKPIAAIYDEDEVQNLDSSPNLTQLTRTALDYLTSEERPFMLLVESEEMDAASHDNDSERVLKGLKSIQETLSLVRSFSKEQGETLVVFTSDHETGGLSVVSDRNYPSVQISWSTDNHTATVVPLLAWGPGAGHFSNVSRNWQIGKRVKNLLSPELRE